MKDFLKPSLTLINSGIAALFFILISLFVVNNFSTNYTAILASLEQADEVMEKISQERLKINQLVEREKSMQLKTYQFPISILNQVETLSESVLYTSPLNVEPVTILLNAQFKEITFDTLSGEDKAELVIAVNNAFELFLADLTALKAHTKQVISERLASKKNKNLWYALFFLLLFAALIVFNQKVIKKEVETVKAHLQFTLKGAYHSQEGKRFSLVDFMGINDIITSINAQYAFISRYVSSLSNADSADELELEINNNTFLKENSILQALRTTKLALQKAKVENEQRTWASEGLANFTEILRKNGDNLRELCQEVLKELITYLNANQGGVFLLIEDENESNEKVNFLEQYACYAYGRRKYTDKVLKIGEGLVGQCYLEKEPIFLTDLPQGYTFISSGIGEATPKSLYLAPLVANGEVLGIIEIASLKVFESHERDFVNKISEVIAGTIASVKINEMTKHLLAVSQQKSEALQSQEEEMRQNLEELEATQEESNRKSIELAKRINTIDESGIISAEFYNNGVTIQINESFKNTVLADVENTNDVNFFKLITHFNGEPFNMNILQQDLSSHGICKGVFSLKIEEKEVEIKGAISQIDDTKRNTQRMLFFGSDITENKVLLDEAKKKAEEIERVRKDEKERSDFEIGSLNDMMNIYMENNRRENDKLQTKIRELEAEITRLTETKQEA
ncbi:MAG: GAF domain-containing protein [Luteibaculaceae bacterium]